ncbi:hypothetical protein ACFLXF_02580 [Chloroflexota bacterium]
MAKTQKIFLIVLIIAIIVAALLISMKAYYVVATLVAGTLIIGHRELWALLRRKKLPPLDERVKENINKSIRNGFIFFAAASAFLMLPFSTVLVRQPSVVHVLGSLLLSGGAVYFLSYLFYDRAEPRLSERELRVLNIFLLIAGIALGTFIISVVLHNVLSGLLHVEEPVFFCIAVFASPVAMAVAIIGSLVIFIRGLSRKLG